MDVKQHYDLLIDENNDPFRDCAEMKKYMDKWDGETLISLLCLDKSKNVLEIGVGTGRLAARTAPLCHSLTGIDISRKTVGRAKENLAELENITLVCGDFLTYDFENRFDVIYSSLTMMHFEDKKGVMLKVSSILKQGGTLCVSIDKSQSEYIDMGTRRLRIYPDTPENIIKLAKTAGLWHTNTFETEFAFIIVCKKV